LRDVLSGWGQVHTPFGLGARATLLSELRALDPQVAAAAGRLLDLVAAFRKAPIQAVAVLPVLR
jgi:hypothetical protein